MKRLSEKFKNVALQSALGFVLARIPDDLEEFNTWYSGRSEKWPADMEVHEAYQHFPDSELRAVIARTVNEQEAAITEALEAEMGPIRSRLEFYSSQYENVLTALDAASGEHGNWPSTPAAMQVKGLFDKSQAKLLDASKRQEQYARVVEGLLDQANENPFCPVGHWVGHGGVSPVLKDIVQDLILDSRGEAQRMALSMVGNVQGIDMMGGRYSGRVVFENKHHVVQSIGRGTAVIHEKSKFAAEALNDVGPQKQARIQYSNGRAVVLTGRVQEHSQSY
jgi:hypothetical protein